MIPDAFRINDCNRPMHTDAQAVGLGPVTGIPLPFVSMGGTSILFTSIAFGIILSVSKDIDEPKKVIVGEIEELNPVMA